MNPEQPVAGAEPDLAHLLTRANVLRARGRLKDAIAQCQQAVERDPESAEAHELLGDLYRQAGRGQEAMEEYRTALARNPQRGVIEEKIARASLIVADRKRMLEHADAVLAGKADRSEVRSPGLAALFSLVVPGLGQVYNREYLKGVLMLLVWVVLLATLALVVLPAVARGRAATDILGLFAAFSSGRALLMGLLLAALWVYAVADAAFRAGKTQDGSGDFV